MDNTPEIDNQPRIIAMGGGGGGGGGGPYGGKGGDGGSVIIGLLPDQVKIQHLKNPHKEYFNFLLEGIKKWMSQHTKLVWSVVIIVILLVAAAFGLVTYTPEVDSPIGKFGLIFQSTQKSSQK